MLKSLKLGGCGPVQGSNALPLIVGTWWCWARMGLHTSWSWVSMELYCLVLVILGQYRAAMVGTWLYWVSSVWGGTVWYLVVLGQC